MSNFHYQKNKTKFDKTKLHLAFNRLEQHLQHHSGGINKLINYIINKLGQNSKAPIPNEILFKGRIRIPILTTRHVESLANQLCKLLKDVDIDSNVIFEKPETGFGNMAYIVLCPQAHKELPSSYFAFQLEQSINERWFSDEYLNILKNSIGILDYSIENIEFLEKKGIPHNKIFYLPIRPISLYKQISPLEYEVLFYGDTNCERRIKILRSLQNKFKVKICCNIFGDDLYKEIRKAKVVVNVHYYKGALLETTRLSELISFGKFIVSEKGINEDENKNFSKFVTFVDEGDVEGLISSVESALKKEDNHIDHDITELSKEFVFYFYRFLLAYDIIAFDQFYYSIGKTIPIKGFQAISLPETIDRNKAFRQKYPEISVFPGLRHTVGWKGCGLSYKFLIKRAQDLNFEQVIICEDDVKLPINWRKKIHEINSFLTDKEWDIFTGLIADADINTSIFNTYDISIGKMVHLDKIVSMVFCIYHSTSFDKIIAWNPNNEDVSNTIDRFIQRNQTLRSFCLLPFFVKLDDSSSTIWNNLNNKTYDQMINDSQKILENKVSNFLNLD